MQTKNNRMVFWLILLCFLIPMVFAGFFYWNHQFDHAARKNHGVLLQPAWSLDEVLPSPLQDSLPKRKWLVLFSFSGECDQQCQERQYELGQVRKALGKNSSRVELLSFPAKTESKNKFPSDDAVWIVDPYQEVILYYHAGTNAKDILEDLRYVLKLSQIG